MIRTKGEAGTGDVVNAVTHMRAVFGGIRRLRRAARGGALRRGEEAARAVRARALGRRERASSRSSRSPPAASRLRRTRRSACSSAPTASSSARASSSRAIPALRAKAIVEATTHFQRRGDPRPRLRRPRRADGRHLDRVARARASCSRLAAGSRRAVRPGRQGSPHRCGPSPSRAAAGLRRDPAFLVYAGAVPGARLAGRSARRRSAGLQRLDRARRAGRLLVLVDPRGDRARRGQPQALAADRRRPVRLRGRGGRGGASQARCSTRSASPDDVSLVRPGFRARAAPARGADDPRRRARRRSRVPLPAAAARGDRRQVRRAGSRRRRVSDGGNWLARATLLARSSSALATSRRRSAPTRSPCGFWLHVAAGVPDRWEPSSGFWHSSDTGWVARSASSRSLYIGLARARRTARAGPCSAPSGSCSARHVTSSTSGTRSSGSFLGGSATSQRDMRCRRSSGRGRLVVRRASGVVYGACIGRLLRAADAARPQAELAGSATRA